MQLPCSGKALVVLAVIALQALTAPVQAETKTVHVVELFTSQGCSSCPPADRLLKTIAGRSDVIALSFHVDYWDRLGWKDTFGSPAFTKRQRGYARSRADGEVYTPQAVIDGRRHVVGHNKSAIEQAMSAAGSDLQANWVAITMTMRNGALLVTATGRPAAKSGDGVVTLLGVQTQGSVAVARGENAGAQLSYSNIVRSMKSLGQWQGSRFESTITGADPALAGADAAVVLIQNSVDGPIIGAARLALK